MNLRTLVLLPCLVAAAFADEVQEERELHDYWGECLTIRSNGHGVVYRSAVPWEFTKNLGWAIVQDGKFLLQRGAINETWVDLPKVLKRAHPNSPIQVWLRIHRGIGLVGYSRVSNIIEFTLPPPPSQVQPSDIEYPGHHERAGSKK